MGSSILISAWRRVHIIAIAVVLAAVLLSLSLPALAQGGASDGAATEDEFSRQLRELKKTFGDIGKQIEDTTRTLDTLKTPETARKGLEDLREHVGKLLGAVADNGDVSRLGVAALNHANAKLKALEQDTRFKPEQKQILVAGWRDLKAATERAIGELDSARRDFAELLRTLQTSEDYIDELLQIRQHEKALEVIHQLTEHIRQASKKLNELLGAKRPGA
jgi:FlaG/FlaF family flagellin (archaellin)